MYASIARAGRPAPCRGRDHSRSLLRLRAWHTRGTRTCPPLHLTPDARRDRQHRCGSSREEDYRAHVHPVSNDCDSGAGRSRCDPGILIRGKNKVFALGADAVDHEITLLRCRAVPTCGYRSCWWGGARGSVQTRSGRARSGSSCRSPSVLLMDRSRDRPSRPDSL
jgi:hypothetical protein